MFSDRATWQYSLKLCTCAYCTFKHHLGHRLPTLRAFAPFSLALSAWFVPGMIFGVTRAYFDYVVVAWNPIELVGLALGLENEQIPARTPFFGCAAFTLLSTSRFWGSQWSQANLHDK